MSSFADDQSRESTYCEEHPLSEELLPVRPQPQPPKRPGPKKGSAKGPPPPFDKKFQKSKSSPGSQPPAKKVLPPLPPSLLDKSGGKDWAAEDCVPYDPTSRTGSVFKKIDQWKVWKRFDAFGLKKLDLCAFIPAPRHVSGAEKSRVGFFATVILIIIQLVYVGISTARFFTQVPSSTSTVEKDSPSNTPIPMSPFFVISEKGACGDNLQLNVSGLVITVDGAQGSVHTLLPSPFPSALSKIFPIGKLQVFYFDAQTPLYGSALSLSDSYRYVTLFASNTYFKPKHSIAPK